MEKNVFNKVNDLCQKIRRLSKKANSTETNFNNLESTLDYAETEDVAIYTTSPGDYDNNPETKFTLIRVGKIVNIAIDQFSGAPNPGSDDVFETNVSTIPDGFRPRILLNYIVQITNNGIVNDGLLVIRPDGSIRFANTDGSVFSGAGGINTIAPVSVSWQL